MTNKPFALTADEIKEIAAVKGIQELWGAESATEMEQILNEAYTVKFNFMSGCPGYVGDLYILQGDSLSSDAPAIRLFRNRDRQLEMLE